MHFTFSLLTVLAFVSLYYTSGITAAAAGMAAVSILQIFCQWSIRGKWDWYEQRSCLLITVSALLAYLFQSPLILQWKVTLLHAGLGLWIVLQRESVLSQALARENYTVPKAIARQADYACIFYTWGVALVNLLVAYTCTEAFWVAFKTSLLATGLLFSCVLIGYLSPYIQEQS